MACSWLFSLRSWVLYFVNGLVVAACFVFVVLLCWLL